MKGACPKCGVPLKKGNIKVVRKPGKRPVRVCRRCQAGSKTVQPSVSELIQARHSPVGPLTITSRVILDGKAIAETVRREIVPDPPQGRQDERHGPLTVEVVYKPPTTPNNRFFMTKSQAEKLQRGALLGKHVTIEVMTAAADTVEDNPEMFVDLVEIEVNWKAE